MGSQKETKLKSLLGYQYDRHARLLEEYEGPGETAKLAECLQHKPEDLSSISSTHIKAGCTGAHP